MDPAFLSDASPNAYEKLIDRLLENNHFGERWARHWLDVVRFGESGGYDYDRDRPNAYHYRDFVIKAFNQDMPFDQFVRWQIAGDQLQPKDLQAVAATGFLVAGAHPAETTSKTEVLVRYNHLDDMISTLGSSMLGLSIGCARCHAHKYDPIPQEDYYRLIVTFSLPSAPQGPGQGGDRIKYGFNNVDSKVKARLSPQEQLEHFVVPKDFEIELVVADPLIINPITVALDDQGRIIVSESHTYRYGPKGSPIKPYANPVIRLDPDGKGSFTRTLVADGFDDPVMGIAIKEDKLWLTANNYLYTYDIANTALEKGRGIAVNKHTLVTDLNKAANPFGMFVLEWGPDGKLYMSVGDHAINLEGPDYKTTGRRMSGRGNSGIIVRMNPDGTKMERLVHGLRVPYSFECDPFGQLWLLSNGEGNPNRFVRVIDGVDYLCYSRNGVGNNWLAGNHPLAPPCEEVHGGAHTQIMRYDAAAYPQEYQGNLFVCNWGQHGFRGANRAIFRFVLNEHNNVIKKDMLVGCTDPHFRPSHIYLDRDGSLLIADWYGRDDESDLTGRIWRLKYVGKDRPVVKHRRDSVEWKNRTYALEALGSPDHLIREKAAQELIKMAKEMLAQGKVDVLDDLAQYARKAPQPLGAANALWTLWRINALAAHKMLAASADHTDWRVRRLALNLMRRSRVPEAEQLAGKLGLDQHPAVLLEAALAQQTSERIAKTLLSALQRGAAQDRHWRYEAAWHLAQHADSTTLRQLLSSDDVNLRLAGLIAIDVACHENFPTKQIALAALAQVLANPGKLDHQLLLTVAEFDGDPSIVPALDKLIARDDIPLSTTAKAILVLKAKASGLGGLSKNLSAAAAKRLIEAVDNGSVKFTSAADQLILLEFLESEGPTPFVLRQLAMHLRAKPSTVRQSAHVLARKFGPAAASLAEHLWPGVLAPASQGTEVLEQLATLARIENQPHKESWEKLLAHSNPLVRADAVRWWRNFRVNQEMVEMLVGRAPELLKQDAELGEDLTKVLVHLGREDQVKVLQLPQAKTDKAAMTAYSLARLGEMSAAEKQKRAALGLQVFERSACTKCHTTATQTTLLAPSLKGIASQNVEYLIESVMYPSKIIKTGFESETIVRTNGKVLTGLVKEEGNFLRILNQDVDTRIPKNEVESRSVSRVSIMPEVQEQHMSRREFVDLIAYLMTLK